MSDEEDRRSVGLKMMNQVYGDGFIDEVPANPTPARLQTIEHLFGEIWSRPGLSVRDRRLLVIGATAMIGRDDLIRIQARGALINGELTPEQLREAVVHLQHYAGWGNATAVNKGIEAAIRDHAAAQANEEDHASEAKGNRQ